jgi:hypothetical protein
MNRELLKKALDVLEKILPELDRRIDRGEQENEFIQYGKRLHDEIEVVLAKPEQEPFAWAREWDGDISDLDNTLFANCKEEMDDNPNWVPLYTSPRPMQRLTDGEIINLNGGISIGVKKYNFARAIEQSLIEKNK